MARGRQPKQKEVKAQVVEQEPIKKDVLSGDADLAHVMRGVEIVRTYSLAQHGKDFIKLASEYADKRKLVLKLDKFQAGIECPFCGKHFLPKA